MLAGRVKEGRTYSCGLQIFGTQRTPDVALVNSRTGKVELANNPSNPIGYRQHPELETSQIHELPTLAYHTPKVSCSGDLS
jgi:hypothetical protein